MPFRGGPDDLYGSPQCGANEGKLEVWSLSTKKGKHLLFVEWPLSEELAGLIFN